MAMGGRVGGQQGSQQPPMGGGRIGGFGGRSGRGPGVVGQRGYQQPPMGGGGYPAGPSKGRAPFGQPSRPVPPPMAMQRPMARPRPVSPPFLSPYEQQETMGRGGGPSPYGGGFGSFQQPSFGGGFGGPTYAQGYGMQGGIGSLLSNYPSYMPPRMPFNPYASNPYLPSGAGSFNSSPGKGMRPQPYGGGFGGGNFGPQPRRRY